MFQKKRWKQPWRLLLSCQQSRNQIKCFKMLIWVKEIAGVNNRSKALCVYLPNQFFFPKKNKVCAFGSNRTNDPDSLVHCSTVWVTKIISESPTLSLLHIYHGNASERIRDVICNTDILLKRNFNITKMRGDKRFFSTSTRIRQLWSFSYSSGLRKHWGMVVSI